MEQVLQLYHQAYDAAYPVVCFDERPCQLLDQVTDPVPMQAGKPLKEDNEYERQGTCSLLVAVEPLTGQRLVETSPTRKGEDYTAPAARPLYASPGQGLSSGCEDPPGTG